MEGQKQLHNSLAVAEMPQAAQHSLQQIQSPWVQEQGARGFREGDGSPGMWECPGTDLEHILVSAHPQ